MTKKYILLGLTSLIIFTLFIQTVSADMIIIGTKPISWCYEIQNINDYSNYVFIFNEERVTGQGIINQGACFNFYKNGLTTIYAIKKTEFDKNIIDSRKPTSKDVMNMSPEERNSASKYFFEINNPKLIKSNLQLSAFGFVQENDPLQKAVITLKIISLTEEELEIQKSKITYTYIDGTTEEKYFQTQEIIPEPSRKAILPGWFAKFWYVIIPFIAAILIGIILFLKRLRK